MYGERGYDFANIFCNPDAATATAPQAGWTRQADIGGCRRRRSSAPGCCGGVLAYAGLSASWSMEDGDKPSLALAVAEIAAAELAGAHGIEF